MPNKESRDLRLITYNQYIRPEVKEYKHKGFVLNGVNNSFYDYLTARYYGSTTHKAVCDSYINLIYGQGLVEKDGDVEAPEWLAFLEMFTEEDQHRVISDYKIYGEFAVQLIPTRGKTLSKILHLEKSKVVPSVADNLGNITSYWYSKDWSKQWQTGYTPKEYPAMGFGKGNETEIYVGKPYNVGKEYFSDPDYLPVLPYAEFEEEVANYYLKYIKNGLSLGNIINVPNSQHWSDEEKDAHESKIKSRLTGSENSNKVLISFNGADTAPSTIESIKNEYAHKQWDFLTVEARQQILTGHKATSPSLVGVISSSGFSNTADEMDEAEHQLVKRVIAPYQNFIIRSIRQILKHYKIDRELAFIPLTEKNDDTNVNESDKEVVKKEEEVVLSSDCDCKKKSIDLDKYAVDEPKGYELYQTDFNLDNVEFRADANSEQDSALWKIRYAYNIGTSKTPKSEGRSFCKKMFALSNKGKVFRKEDIDKMSADGVNGEFAHEGGKYNIFLYAGGVNCHHRWERRIYKKNRDEDGKPLGGNALQNTKPFSVSEARRQGAKIPVNPKDVAIAEIDKPNKGSLR